MRAVRVLDGLQAEQALSLLSVVRGGRSGIL